MRRDHLFNQLHQRLQEPRRFIQVLLGPRQVGKTTLSLQVAKAMECPSHYVSADLATLQDLSWITQQWEVARRMVDKKKGGLFIIDEVQKIPNWSEAIKALWDEDSRTGCNLAVVILGSSPWLMQKGLSESLTGRFEILPVTHWSFTEMHIAFQWEMEKYLYFGGYPGAAALAEKDDSTRWNNYVNDAIIETTISRDILLMTQVNKPVLLRRLFQVGCAYSGQILSYTKMLGELQDAGNTTTLAHYLDLLMGAGLLAGLQKFAIQTVRQRASSPKLMVFNTALLSAQMAKTFQEARQDHVFWGRLVESAIGAYLLNAIRGTQINLFYWREQDREVDFVLQRGDSITAIEVKSGSNKQIRLSGMDLFASKFRPKRMLLVGEGGMPIETFLQTPITELV